MCLNTHLEPWLRSGMECFIHSVDFKKTNKMVKVFTSTSSWAMVPDLLRKKGGFQLSILFWYQLMHSTRSDQSPSITSTMTGLLAFASLIRMGHYSGRLVLFNHGWLRRQLCWKKTKWLRVWRQNETQISNIFTLTSNFKLQASRTENKQLN